MICPNCGTRIDDGATVCPACHFDLGRTSILPKLQGTWCPSCGSLIPDGADVCPHCGLPVARRLPHARRQAARLTTPPLKINRALDERLPEIDAAPEKRQLPTVEDLEAEKAQTSIIPRIESAIPSEPDAYSDDVQRERIPRLKTMVVTAAAAVLLVGGVVIGITHPWDPEAFATKARTPADTSQAGSIGEVQELSQDSSAQSETVSGDEYSYQQLHDYWEQLGSLASSLDENEQLFDQVATSGDAQARADGKDKAEALSYQISNLISSIGSVDTTSGTYADTASKLSDLGNYLRNRSDGINKAWQRSVDSDDPASDAASIEQPVKQDAASFKSLFDQGYQEAEPQQAS